MSDHWLVVGLGNAMEMLLSGDRYGADHALRIGLVNRIVPQDRLLADSLDYAARLATRGPVAQRFAKQVAMESVGRPMLDALKLESRSHDPAFTEDLAEGTAAFREKRDAAFRGR